ncbi:MAG: aminodeoxychorismate/anthranilate synthase component II [Bacteroidota bacterium]
MSAKHPRILLLDNFDSFTWNLADYFARCGAAVSVKRNDTDIKKLLRPAYDCIALSPGPGRPEDAGVMMELIERTAGRIPLFGICLGHQALGLHFGADVIRAAAPVHGKISLVENNGIDIYKDIPQKTEVVRYHSLLLSNLPACLEETGHSEMGEIMSIKHRELPVRGVQYHPEAALTRNGLQIINNLVTLILQHL